MNVVICFQIDITIVVAIQLAMNVLIIYNSYAFSVISITELIYQC